jgi:hypothetical protein
MNFRSSVLIGVFAIAVGTAAKGLSIHAVRFADVTFRNASVEEVVNELGRPGRIAGPRVNQALNIILLPNAGKGRLISGHWELVKATDLINEVAKQGNMSVRVDSYAVVLGPPNPEVRKKRDTDTHVVGEAPAVATQLIVRGFEFREATIPQIVDFLNQKVTEFGQSTAEFGRREERVAFEVQCERADELPPVTFALWNVPLSEVVR